MALARGGREHRQHNRYEARARGEDSDRHQLAFAEGSRRLSLGQSLSRRGGMHQVDRTESVLPADQS